MQITVAYCLSCCSITQTKTSKVSPQLFDHRTTSVERVINGLVKEGDRIAQLILERCEHPAVMEVEVRMTVLFLQRKQ